MDLLDTLNKTSAGNRRTGRSAFLAKRDEIAEALEAGYSVVAIWEALTESGDIEFQYPQFAKYVRTIMDLPRSKPLGSQAAAKPTPHQYNNKGDKKGPIFLDTSAPRFSYAATGTKPKPNKD